MESNQTTIHLKPVYPHSQINLYSGPVISAAVPTLSLASGFNIVSATNGSTNGNIEANNLNALATIQSVANNSAQLVPMTANNVCLNNIQIQHIQMHQPSTFNSNQPPNLSSRHGGTNGIDQQTTTSSKVKESNANFVNLSRASCSSSSNSAISMKLSSSDSSLVSLKSTNGKGFKCQICNRDFTQKGNLKTHLMTHSGERPYECQTCGKNFTQKGNLDTHVKIHTETKDHKCQFCDKGFTQRGNLKTHIRSIHTKEKPYSCGHCGKSFSQKGNMLTHYRTHDKEARFPCNVCGKTFSQKGNLKTHQQRHGRGTGR